MYSAYAPKLNPVAAKTLLPCLNNVTFSPTASISPASSIPSTFFLGPLKPITIRITGLTSKSWINPIPGLKLRILVSPICTVVACIFTNISLSFGIGFLRFWS